MAKTETAPAALTKAQWSAIGSRANKLQAELNTLADEVQTQGITDPKLKQALAYQAGMVRYAARQLEALVESTGKAAATRTRAKKS